MLKLIDTNVQEITDGLHTIFFINYNKRALEEIEGLSNSPRTDDTSMTRGDVGFKSFYPSLQ